MSAAKAPDAPTRLLDIVDSAAARLEAAGVSFGHGTDNAFDEAAWLVLWQLGLPLDTPLEAPVGDGGMAVAPQQCEAIDTLLARRIATRVPAAYLTGEAWLQGVPFHADARAIVPRSLIAELLVSGALDYWVPEAPRRVLDMCTGGASLAILAALHWPGASVDAADISTDALAVAQLNRRRHGLEDRVRLLPGDGWAAAEGVYDLVLCNPPYVNSASMDKLPPEYRAEPSLALAGGVDGMDFVRSLLWGATPHMAEFASLVLEIGHERDHFEAAFPGLEAIWLDTSAGGDQVCILTRAALAACNPPTPGATRHRQNPNP
jgi:ribosomal protein L3 glutamine methyltransferase